MRISSISVDNSAGLTTIHRLDLRGQESFLSLMRFPPGEPIFISRPFNTPLLAELDRLFAKQVCQEGWFDVENDEQRLTCLIHQSKPYLAGLIERNNIRWIPLAELTARWRQLEQSRCSLYRSDLVQVLMMAVHFRQKPKLQADTNLVDLEHVLDVLSLEGRDAALALERSGLRTLMFLQRGIPARLYFGDKSQDPGEGNIAERFLLFGFAPHAEVSRIEVFDHLTIKTDPSAGLTLVELDTLSKPPPPTHVQFFRASNLVLQRVFMPPSMMIGRDLVCELRLDNLSVSWRHAKLSWENGRFLVTDLGSSNGTLVNRQKIEQRSVGYQDLLQVGNYQVRLTQATSRPSPQATIMLAAQQREDQLHVVQGQQSVQLVRELIIGKVNGVDLVAKGVAVRSIHARLRNLGSGKALLSCVGKAHGKLNGKRVRSAELRPNDEFVIGKTRFHLVSVPAMEQ